MKWIGELRVPAGEDSVEFKMGHEYIDFRAVIEKDEDGRYYPHLYKVFPEGELGDDEMDSLWSTTLGSAKKRLGQDRFFKGSDFTWRIEQ